MKRDPKQNPFMMINPVFWLTRYFIQDAVYEYSEKPGKWGWASLVKEPITYPIEWLNELARDWNERPYDPSFDPHPLEEMELKMGAYYIRTFQENPETADSFEESDQELYEYIMTNHKVPNNVMLN